MTKLTPSILFLICCLTRPAWAGNEQDRARAALEAGTILSLSAIQAIVAKQVPGKLIDVELDQKNGLWVYKLEIRDTKGQLIELKLNASSGAILDMDGDDD